MYFSVRSGSVSCCFFLFLLVGLSCLTGPWPYTWANEKPDAVTFRNVEVREVEEGREISVDYASPLPSGTRVMIYVRPSIGRETVATRQFQLEEEEGSLVFGPFENLWISTYTLTAAVRPVRNDHVEADFQQYNLTVDHSFSMPGAPPEEEQKEAFQQIFRDVIRAFRSAYLELSSGVMKELRPRRYEGENTESLRNDFEALRSEINRKEEQIRTLKDRLQSNFSGKGSPYLRELEMMNECMRLFTSYRDTLEPTVFEDWEPDDPEVRGWSRRRRISQGVASPGDLRTAFLNTFHKLRLLTDITPTADAIQRHAQDLLDYYRRVLSLYLDMLSASEGDARDKGELQDEWNRSIQDLSDKISTVRERVDRLLLLFRDAGQEGEEPESTLVSGRQLLEAIVTLEDELIGVENILEENRSTRRETERFQSVLNGYITLLRQHVNKSTTDLKQFINRLRSLLVLGRGRREGQWETLRSDTLPSVLRQLRKHSEKYRPRLENILNVPGRQPDELAGDVQEQFSTFQQALTGEGPEDLLESVEQLRARWQTLLRLVRDQRHLIQNSLDLTRDSIQYIEEGMEYDTLETYREGFESDIQPRREALMESFRDFSTRLEDF